MIHDSLKHLAVSIDSLTPDPANARKHGDRNLDQIAASPTAFGQRKPIVVQQEGLIVRAGNGTLQAAKSLGWTEIAAVVVDEDNTSAAQFAIADNRTAQLAEWDTETLATLLDGMEADARKLVGFDDAEIQALIEGAAPDWDGDPWTGDAGGESGQPTGSASGDDPENSYTQKVIAPVYEPKGDKPDVETLVDTTRTDQLQVAIDQTEGLPDDVRWFLNAAAERHTEFRFDRIAEFYAHAEPEVQRLMEDSALVIIDFKDAISKGFVKLNDAIHEQFDKEYPDAR